MKNEEKKCCPFCGNRSLRVRLRDTFQQMSVFCDNCNCIGPLAYSAEDAISDWNNATKREITNGR